MLPPPQHDSVVHNLGSTVCSQQADGDKESCRIWCYFGLGNRIFIPWTLLPWLQPDSSGSYTLPSVEHFAWPPWNPCCLTEPPLLGGALLSREYAGMGWDKPGPLMLWCHPCGDQEDGQSSPGTALSSGKALHIPGTTSASQFSCYSESCEASPGRRLNI